jgi:hypothetical protein
MWQTNDRGNVSFKILCLQEVWENGEEMTPFRELRPSEQLTLKQEAVRVEKLPPGYKVLSEGMEHDETIKRS